jgi:hypothetical protein
MCVIYYTLAQAYVLYIQPVVQPLVPCAVRIRTTIWQYRKRQAAPILNIDAVLA